MCRCVLGREEVVIVVITIIAFKGGVIAMVNVILIVNGILICRAVIRDAV